MPSRSLQVASEIHHLLSRMVMEEISPAHFGLVTITDVLLTDGMEHARVYVSSLNRNPEIETLLNHKKGYFHHRLKKEMAMRKVPDLEFIFDISAEQYEKIDRA